MDMKLTFINLCVLINKKLTHIFKPIQVLMSFHNSPSNMCE